MTQDEKKLDNQRSSEWRIKNRHKYTQKMRRLNVDPLRRAKILLNGARFRAKYRGMPFDLDLDFVTNRLLQMKCEATGESFDMKPGSSSAPSIDRRDNKLGYTKDNCWLVTRKFNTRKGCRRIDEIPDFKAYRYGKRTSRKAVLAEGFVLGMNAAFGLMYGGHGMPVPESPCFGGPSQSREPRADLQP